MGKVQKKGEKGAARAFITRTQAVKKLQCSLADFRRLCILKGSYFLCNLLSSISDLIIISKVSFPVNRGTEREPIKDHLRPRRSITQRISRTSHTSLSYENSGSIKPLRRSFPEHLDVGSGVVLRAWRRINLFIDWIISSKKGSLDHFRAVSSSRRVSNEAASGRYPTFIDALRDIDDALCLIFLFASLPSDSRVSADLIDTCSRLSSEWLLYVMHSRSLRKVFLSIKGVYYQAEVMGEKITWLVPYMFTQSVRLYPAFLCRSY
jgi:pescadillo protein